MSINLYNLSLSTFISETKGKVNLTSQEQSTLPVCLSYPAKLQYSSHKLLLFSIY